MLIQLLKKIINKVMGQNHFIELLDRMRQLENSHINFNKFHLFHFHEECFEQSMNPKYTVVEKLVFQTPSFAHNLYAFQKK